MQIPDEIQASIIRSARLYQRAGRTKLIESSRKREAMLAAKAERDLLHRWMESMGFENQAVEVADVYLLVEKDAEGLIGWITGLESVAEASCALPLIAPRRSSPAMLSRLKTALRGLLLPWAVN